MSPSRSLYIDDRDPAIIYSSLTQSSGVWKGYRGEPNEFMQTTSNAKQAGATATITFIGCDISVFGTVSEASLEDGLAPLTHYILDSNLPFAFQPTLGDNRQYNVTFYQSPQNLSAGSHTLQIALQSAGNYWLDYIVINGNALVSVGDDLITNSTTLKNPSSPPGSVPPSSPSPSGAIIATGILGGLLGLLLLLGLLWFIRRRRSRQQSHNSQETLVPFISLFNHSTAGTRGSTMAQMSDCTGTSSTLISSRTNKCRDTVVEPPPVYFSPQV